MTVSEYSPISPIISPESHIVQTVTAQGTIKTVISADGTIYKSGSTGYLGVGGVLGTDWLGDFILGDPTPPGLSLWIDKKSVIS